MSTSTLSIPADTEQVRVARLVAGSAARRAGVAQDDIEDVRLAVGEAVGRAVLKHIDAAVDAPVIVEFRDGSQAFGVSVIDQAPTADPDTSLAKAVISGLVADATFSSTTVVMSWAL